MPGYLTAHIICSEKRTVFRELDENVSSEEGSENISWIKRGELLTLTCIGNTLVCNSLFLELDFDWTPRISAQNCKFSLIPLSDNSYTRLATKENNTKYLITPESPKDWLEF